MKTKLRKYEQLLIDLLGLMTIGNYLLQHFGLAPVYLDGFSKYLKSHPNVHFNYSAYILLPRIGVVLLFGFIYFWVNNYFIINLAKLFFNYGKLTSS